MSKKIKVAFIHVGLECVGIEIFSSMLNNDFPEIDQKLFFEYDVAFDHDSNNAVNMGNRLFKAISEYEPKLCCVTLYTDTAPLLLPLLKKIKQFIPCQIIAGGHHATLLQADLLKQHDFVDFLAIGESEDLFREFIIEFTGNKQWNNIKGLLYRQNNTISQNVLRQKLPDLDLLPIPNKGIFLEKLSDIYKNYIIVTGRGCPFSCTYCTNSYYNDLFGKSNRVRRRTPGDVISELESHKYKIEYVYFEDDVFLTSEKYLQDFLPVYKEKIGKPFFCYTAPQYVSKSKVQLLKDAGCESIGLGIQSGSEVIRKKYFHRNDTNKQIETASQVIKQQNIRLAIDLILGVPFETDKDTDETFSLVCKILPDTIQTSFLCYYPRLRITELAYKDKYLSEEEFNKIQTGNYHQSYLKGTHLKKDAKKAYSVGAALKLFSVMPIPIKNMMIKYKAYKHFPSSKYFYYACYFISLLFLKRSIAFIQWIKNQLKIF